MSRFYFDSNIFIYSIEGKTSLQANLDKVFDMLEASDGVIITSYIAKLEVLRKPLRESDLSLINDYEAIFSHEKVKLIPVSENIIAKTLEVFKAHNFKLADAIHIATGLIEKADFFITNDAGLFPVKELNVKLLSEF